MDDLIRESMDGFDEVWRRVTGRPGTGCVGKAPAAEEILTALIQAEACAAQMSAALARICQGQARQVLARHAAGAKARLRRLRAEYFIAAGAAAPVPGPCPVTEGRQAALRRLYLDAAALADRYEQAAGEAEDEALKEVLAAFTRESRVRAKELRALLVESF